VVEGMWNHVEERKSHLVAEFTFGSCCASSLGQFCLLPLITALHPIYRYNTNFTGMIDR